MIKFRYVVSFVLLFAAVSMSAQKVSVEKYKGGKVCATSFTFDDGHKDNYTMAAPELEKRGWKGTFWLNCSMIPGEVKQKKNRMTWDDVCDLHSRGHEISNHGWRHLKLTEVSLEDAVREIERNDSAILAHTGVRPVTFCYSYNAKNDEVVALASKGRVGTRMFQSAFGEQSSDKQLRARMEKTVAGGGWLVWMTHGLTEGYDHFKDLSRYASFLDYVKGREDQIWVGTFRDVAAYIAERDAIEIEVTGKGRRMKVTSLLNLDPTLYNVPLTMSVETTSGVRVRQSGRSLDVFYRDGKAYFDFNPHGGKIIISFR